MGAARRLTRWGRRHLDLESRPAAGRALDVDRATVLLDDGAHDRQAEARASRLPVREEGLEDPPPHLLRHAAAAVLHADDRPPGPAGAQEAERAAARHGLQGVRDEI